MICPCVFQQSATTSRKCYCYSCTIFRMSKGDTTESVRRRLLFRERMNETTKMSNTPSVTVESSGVTDMDRLMKEMQSLHERRESEMSNLKSKCTEMEATKTEMETMKTSLKKMVQMDKLESKFDAYKLETKKQLETLENDKKTLQTSINALTRELDCERARNKDLALEITRRKTTEANLKKKVTNLNQSLAAEKSTSKTKIDKLTHELNNALLKSTEPKLQPQVEVPKVDDKLLTKELNSSDAKLDAKKTFLATLKAYATQTDGPVLPKNENYQMISSSQNASVVISTASIISTKVIEKEEILSTSLNSPPKNNSRGRKRKSIYSL
ncbi:cytadherence high molecular weight protein 2-like isoform X2 [Planococcus citri]|uniref:cytadherence high molecular weight protein 2-like isoform X2 n=1 Tax=Planococcus citri TaxID=170843 RepID=UPI0031F97196